MGKLDMFIVYDILYIIFTICYLPFFLIKGKYHRGILMRLGIFSQNTIDKIKNQKIIWLHTVSVGEAQAARTLVKNLKQEYPNFRLVISTVTKTGNKIAQELVDSRDLVIYFPLDVSFIVKKVIGFINPKLLIIVETEIWPNLVVNLAEKGVPIVLVNGRVSSSSFIGYRIIRPFLKGVLQKFSLFCMQTKEDAQRIITLGANRDRVKVTGNMKFDVGAAGYGPEAPDLRLGQDERLFIAGSTHRGEEKIVLQVFKQLLRSYSNLRLLIAPRHIERVQEIEKLISEFRFKPQRLSQLNSNQWGAMSEEQRVLILDTIGQLKTLYAHADVVFIGGSLVKHGGQNPIEPAVFSKPILLGPYTSNFSYITKIFLKKRAAIIVKNAQQLKDTCINLLNEPIARRELGERAKELIRENEGSTLKNLQLIKGLIKGG